MFLYVTQIPSKALCSYSAISPSVIGVCHCSVCWLTIGNKYQGCFVSIWISHSAAPFCIPHLIFCSWLSSCWYLVSQVRRCKGTTKDNIFWDRWRALLLHEGTFFLICFFVSPVSLDAGMQSSLLALALANKFFPDPLVGVPPAVSVCELLPSTSLLQIYLLQMELSCQSGINLGDSYG